MFVVLQNSFLHETDEKGCCTRLHMAGHRFSALSSKASILDLAGLLTRSPPPGLPMHLCRRTVASFGGCGMTELTAAGLSRTLTWFPFDAYSVLPPHLYGIGDSAFRRPNLMQKYNFFPIRQHFFIHSLFIIRIFAFAFRQTEAPPVSHIYSSYTLYYIWTGGSLGRPASQFSVIG